MKQGQGNTVKLFFYKKITKMKKPNKKQENKKK